MIECSILMADFKILIRATHDYVVQQCLAYTVPTPWAPEEADLIVSASPEELAAERQASPAHMPDGYIESICIYRAICRRLPLMGGMLLHAAVLSDGERGYAFTADSGTGKTTHIRMWEAAFGSEIQIVNGDKPLVRRRDGVWYAYGTPWCGKEGWNVNTSVPLSAICFLRRGKENRIEPYPTAQAVTDIMPQLLIPAEPDALMATLDLVDGLLTDVPLYELHCTISLDAARVARAGLSQAMA